MGTSRKTMPRVLQKKASVDPPTELKPSRYDSPRASRRTVIDFSSLSLPEDLRLALDEAFWEHFGARARRVIRNHWLDIKTFNRFALECNALVGLDSINGDLLVRYVEWLNKQCRTSGQPWTKASRACAYTTLRTLLLWIERCRPEVIGSIEYPINPFPWRNRDTPPREKISARNLKALLKACENDITAIRKYREVATAERSTADCSLSTLGGLLNYIDQHFDGIVPPWLELSVPEQSHVRQAFIRYGGIIGVEPCLYPRTASLLPYYLAILIHTAGNPDPIAELESDCLQPLPLLDDQEAIVWLKRRANRVQRRTFSSNNCFEPPSLVSEILQWNEKLRPLAPIDQRHQLFLCKGLYGVSVLKTAIVRHMLKAFCTRHNLPIFSLSSIRPGVLSSFYRVSGDLRKTKLVANHASIATTISYVETPEVKAENYSRIAALQGAFIGHIEQTDVADLVEVATTQESGAELPVGKVTSMFGFDCKNPFNGAAPGTRRGELCTNFMGCFTCPNAIITQDPPTLARLLQARDHLQTAAASLHPARWKAFYAPQLRILIEDILPRFTVDELAAARALMIRLPPLPELR